jgi:hypothetical protein
MTEEGYIPMTAVGRRPLSICTLSVYGGEPLGILPMRALE